jgi:hypothetical protein
VIEPTNPSFKESDKLQLTLTGEGRSMYALKRTGSTVTSIGYHVDQLIISDLKGLKESNSLLYILVTNYQSTPPTYTGTSTMTLDALVTGGGSSNYLNYYESQFKTAAIGLDGTIPRFLIDVKSVITSPLPDFRVSVDSLDPWYQARWMELRYLLPTGSFSKSIQVTLTTKDLLKNPATTYNWDNPYISQIHVYISDKNGQKDYYYNYTETLTFTMEFDQNQASPFCNIDAEVKDPVNQWNSCTGVFFSLAVYWDH